ncbi:ran-binding protein 9 isoform X3 [Crocuta crocuta]
MGIGLSAQGVNMNRLPGIAFTDLPPNLYPTVGLQTPGEVVDANFGQHPFVFDIEDYMREWRTKIQAQIDRFPIGDREGEWQTMIQKMVSSYLVHHGYCATAEAFARSTDQTVLEELASIKNRQRIQKLVLAGRMGEAIETTQQLYPSLLERNPNLLFTLKVRQFIEMVNGTDSEVRCLGGRSPKSQDSYPVSPRPFGSPSMSPSHGVSIHSLAPGKGSSAHFSGFESCSNGVISNKAHQSYCHSKHQSSTLNVPELNSINMSRSQQVNNFTSNDVDMETEHYSNGVGETSSNGFLNGSSKHDHEMEDCDTEMEVDSSQLRRQLCGGSQAAIERMIHFGRELQAMSEQLRRECGKNTANKKMLKDAFSLLAYSDPWNSPVGNQLDPIQREPVCSALNSAILETHNLPKQPPLALAMGQATQCLGLMARSGIGSCAFATVEDYLH